jgi:hypothetical protein
VNPQLVELELRVFVTPIELEESLEPLNCLLEPPGSLGDFGQTLEGDHILWIEVGHPEERPFSVGIGTSVEVAAALDNVRGNVARVLDQANGEELEGIGKHPLFAIGFSERREGEPKGVLLPAALQFLDLAGGRHRQAFCPKLLRRLTKD